MFDPHIVRASHGHVHQVDVLTDLLHGHYDSVTTVGEVFPNTLLGLGVADCLDGEIVSVDGETWRIPASGVPEIAAFDVGLPFAVSASGGTPIASELSQGATHSDISTFINRVVYEESDAGHAIAAIRIDGTFTDVLLRSEHRQVPPFVHLDQALREEVRFSFQTWHGTVVGFAYPLTDDFGGDGVVIPGLHLHAISQDRNSGGHVHDLTVDQAEIRIWLDDCVVDIPRSRVRHALALLHQVRDHGAPKQRDQAVALLEHLNTSHATASDFAQAIALHDAYLHDPYLDK